MPKEIETKFKIKSPSELRKRLKRIKARPLSKNLERDEYYKIPSVKKNIEVIRLRTIGKKGLFSIKFFAGKGKSPIYKIREEVEIKIENPGLFKKMLMMLGFQRALRKEKIRETYGWKGAKILLDKLPYIGYYVEIEAPKKKIKILASKLSFDIKKGIAETYLEIFRKFCKYRKKPYLELIFHK